MLKKIIIAIVRSRVGQILFLIHLILFVLCVINLRASTDEQYYSHFLKNIFFTLILFDFPIALPLNKLINYLGIPPTNFRDSIMGFILSFQWWIIGYLIEATFKFFRRKV